MTKQVFINLPVSDLTRTEKFYSALGFTKNNTFSDDHAISMVWSNEIYFMLLTRDFYKEFIREKSVIDTKSTSGALIALSLEDKEDVQRLADIAQENGGEVFKAGPQAPEDMMIGYEILDPDGNQLEFVWMNAEFTGETD